MAAVCRRPIFVGGSQVCIALSRLPDGTQFPCRKCWQCIENRVNDWVGRCIAESKTARASHAITLTYGRDEHGKEDHPRAKVLTYSDVQRYFKLLRRHGFPCRYFAVGEYGSMKGRAHWHLVVYWLDAVPPHELDVRFDEAHWPHGVSHWTEPTPAAIRYNTKYIQKDIGVAERQGHLMMSKKPPLGSEYFRCEAERYVDAGLAPQDLRYSFDEARDKQGDKIEFYLRGKTADVFLEHFVRMWGVRRPGRPMPRSELVEEFMDRGAWTDRGAVERERDLDYRQRYPDVPKPRVRGGEAYSWMSARTIVWNKDMQAWEAPGPPGRDSRMYWQFIPAKGAFGWREGRSLQSA